MRSRSVSLATIRHVAIQLAAVVPAAMVTSVRTVYLVTVGDIDPFVVGAFNFATTFLGIALVYQAARGHIDQSNPVLLSALTSALAFLSALCVLAAPHSLAFLVAAAILSAVASIGASSIFVYDECPSSEHLAQLGSPISVRSALGRLDVIINNAGQQPVAGLTDISGDDFRAMMDANVGGPFALTKALAKAGHGGCVVNIASIEALQPAAGHSHYATSKAALVMFTRAAALELGPLGIRVNAISPGLIGRDGLEAAWPEGVARWQAAAPLQRLGTPQDVADAAR